MDALEIFLNQVRFNARHLFSDRICGLSPTHYAGTVGYLHFFRGGKLTVLPESADAMTLDRPTLLFYPSAWAHHLHGDEALGAQMLCCVVESGAGMQRVVNTVLPRVLIIPVSDAPGMQATLDVLMTEADGKGMGWRLTSDRLFESLIAQIVRWAVEHDLVSEAMLAGFGDARLARSLNAVHGDLIQDWSVGRLAALAGMSRSSFAARFSEAMGETPADYVLNVRLSAAQNFLLRGFSAKQAAAEAGFSSSAVFARAFRRSKGLTPLEWLAQNQAAAS